MSDQTILCPNCHSPISVTASLSAQIRQQIEGEFTRKQQLESEKIAQERKHLQEEQAKLKNLEQSMEKNVEDKVKKEKERLWAIAKVEAAKLEEQKSQSKFKELEEENKKKTEELRKAEQNEIELRKKSREVEEKAAKLELEVQRKLDEGRQKIASDSKKQADEEHRLRMLEKEKQLDMMRQQIEELKRKSEQGSMQIQGEVQEEDLKKLLLTTFPLDSVSDVEKGIRGADVIQSVKTPLGQTAGLILWESKNVKSWKDEWIIKLKEDQNIVKADICVLVTKVLPKGAESFTRIHNVWVVNYESVALLTSVLRSQLIEIQHVTSSLVGRDEKMELLYTYLSGAQFKNRVENIVSAFLNLQTELSKEKRAMQTIWSRREKEIDRVINNTTGMYGDLQGMIGSALAPVSLLELPEEAE